jgi:phage terminase large subunit GpA-like protein
MVAIPKTQSDDFWTVRLPAAFEPPPDLTPSQWAPIYFEVLRGARRGPYNHDNAPYWRGLMDIATRPGCVQLNVGKAGQIGGSTLLRTLMAYWAHVDPAPMGLTLPSRDKGRGITKTDVLPLFREVKVLRNLIGNISRDVLIESVTLLNGFSLDLMWSGSATSLASNPYQRVINDEVDKFEAWTGDEPDAVAATEGRLTSYEDRRLQVNMSTPTTTAGKIHQLIEHSTVHLLYHVPCPHCGEMQPLKWEGIRYMDHQCAVLSLEAARAAAAAGELAYAITWDASAKEWTTYKGQPCLEFRAGESTCSPIRFAGEQELAAHIRWLERIATTLAGEKDRRRIANVISGNRARAVWYECRNCHGRITPADKAVMVRSGRWRSPEGPVTDADGALHEDAEDVKAWPVETRIGAPVGGLYCLWLHWGTLVSEWLGSQNDPAALFFFFTFRLGEAFQFRNKTLPTSVFADKVARGALAPGIVPAWAWVLAATLDTQPDRFYGTVRAWGAGMRSARVWHGTLTTFAEIDHLLMRPWPVDGGEFPPMTISRALIDSGGTEDRILDLSRTVQVYRYVIPRQPAGVGPGVVAIKGASRPGLGLYWPMKNPMAGGGKIDLSDLRALMVDTHKANDLLAGLITAGTPAKPGAPTPSTPEAWLLSRIPDDATPEIIESFGEYNNHMAAVQRTVDPKSKAEVWIPAKSGLRHDYRDCEAYQIVAAYLMDIHTLPPDQDTLAVKRAMMADAQQIAEPPPAAGDGFEPRDL